MPENEKETAGLVLYQNHENHLRMEIAKKAVDYIVQDDSNLQCSKEDLYQEACEIALMSLNNYDADKGDGLNTYLTKCIKSRLINVIKKNQYTFTEVSIDGNDSDYDSYVPNYIKQRCCNESFTKEIESKMALESLKSYFDTIDARNKETIYKIIEKKIEGKSGLDIARELNMSRTSVAHALQSFASKLDKSLVYKILGA